MLALLLTVMGAVLGPGEAPPDARLHPQRDTNTVFTMPRYTHLDAWEAEAEQIRRRMLLGSGIYPWPQETPLNAKVYDPIERDGYVIEKVHFEAAPGFLVTGNLYRPLEGEQLPGVLNPHGHWPQGRVHHDERGSVAARCITFARMGMVAFSYDMLGYNDSLQLDHRFEGDAWKLWGLHPFGLQLLASIRAVDFLQSLPQVDPQRIACVGASGGGTQTFALYSVDGRVAAAAPVNMISSTMQGGCICENAPLIRIEHNNMEIGAAMAPRPLLMVSASGDWTAETPRVEYPAIRSIYALYNAEKHLEQVQIDAEHNFNAASRAAVYPFMSKWLLREPMQAPAEEDITAEELQALRLFPDNELPEGFLKGDALLQKLREQRQEATREWLPVADADRVAFAAENLHLFEDLTGARQVHGNDLKPERRAVVERDGYVREHWLLRHTESGAAVPAMLYRGANARGEAQDSVLLVHGEGKAALADAAGEPGELVRRLLDKGRAVLLIDLFLTGEYHTPAQESVRDASDFADTFLPTVTSARVQDVLIGAGFLMSRRDVGAVSAAGLADAGMWCLFAAAIDPRIAAVAADLNQFPLDDDAAWVARQYIPSIRAAGGLQAALALTAPRPATLFNNTYTGPVFRGARLVDGALPLAELSELL